MDIMKFKGKNVDMLTQALEKSPEEVLLKLHGYFVINSPVTTTHDLHLLSMRESIFIDFLFNVVTFSNQAKYNNAQTACILNIADELMANVKAGMGRDKNLGRLKEMVQELMKTNTDPHIPAFSLDQCQRVFHEFVKSLFRSYGLFLYVFTKEQKEMVTSEERTVEHLPVLPPLERAIPEQTWLQGKQREQDALREAEAHRARQAAEAERRRLEDIEAAERLKDVSLQDASEALTPETLQALTEKVIQDHVGPLCSEMRNRILAEQKVIIKEAGLHAT